MTDEATPARPRLPGVTRPGRRAVPQKAARVPGRPRLALGFVVVAVLLSVAAIVQAAAFWFFVPFALFAAVIFALGGTPRPWNVPDNSLFQQLHKNPGMVYGTLEYDQLRGYDRRD